MCRDRRHKCPAPGGSPAKMSADSEVHECVLSRLLCRVRKEAAERAGGEKPQPDSWNPDWAPCRFGQGEWAGPDARAAISFAEHLLSGVVSQISPGGASAQRQRTEREEGITSYLLRDSLVCRGDKT
ncbi:hypothetical protein JZ751_001888, partial [Albula glossodonta]